MGVGNIKILKEICLGMFVGIIFMIIVLVEMVSYILGEKNELYKGWLLRIIYKYNLYE